ncbi:MAG: FHA domain-containing protein [Gammaproteobacteria bacterium]|nr:FHA domain-containing protein [Gammaproteobacteria bacterium]
MVQVGEQGIRLRQPADLDFILTPRTSVPTESLDAYAGLGGYELTLLGRDSRVEERRMLRVLAESYLSESTEDSVGHWLNENAGYPFPGEHQWQQILTAIAELPPLFEPYKQLALAKYSQFLAARSKVIQALHSHANGSRPPTTGEDNHAMTSIDSMWPLTNGAPSNVERIQLKRGEPWRISLQSRTSLDVWFAEHPFELVVDTGLKLISKDAGANTSTAARGLIGRAPDCGLRVDSLLTNVSRIHLLWIREARSLTLVDLSTHGTLVELARG